MTAGVCVCVCARARARVCVCSGEYVCACTCGFEGCMRTGKRAYGRAPTYFLLGQRNGACAHYVMVSTFQWKPFWLATQRDPQNDWAATQNRVNYDVFAQAPMLLQVMIRAQ